MLVFGATEKSVVIELIKLYRISYPYVIDKKRSLLKENESLSNKKYHTFIVNSGREILC